MMSIINVLILVGGIICVLLALVTLCLFLVGLLNLHEGGVSIELGDKKFDEEEAERFTKRVMLITGALCIIFSAFAYRAYTHLFINSIEVLVFFGLWYAVGFASRILLLIWEHALFSNIFATDWERMLGVPLFALLGPIETARLINALTIKR